LAAQLVESAGQFGPKQPEIALDALGSADHHMIAARNPLRRHDLAGQRAEAPLHAVADDGAPDLLGDGESNADRRVLIVAIADEKDEAGRCRAPAGVRRDEIGPPLKRD
jgi:hypothetical protein